jgi:hypothetical protein
MRFHDQNGLKQSAFCDGVPEKSIPAMLLAKSIRDLQNFGIILVIPNSE